MRRSSAMMSPASAALCARSRSTTLDFFAPVRLRRRRRGEPTPFASLATAATMRSSQRVSTSDTPGGGGGGASDRRRNSEPRRRFGGSAALYQRTPFTFAIGYVFGAFNRRLSPMRSSPTTTRSSCGTCDGARDKDEEDTGEVSGRSREEL